MATDDNDGVGYRRPPRHSQFKPGQSGNPRGRPKGAKSMAQMLRAALNQRVYVIEGGRRRSVTKLEAMTTQLVNKAIGSDLSAVKLLLLMQEAVEKREGTPTTHQVEFSQDDEDLMKQLLERMQKPDKEQSDG